MNEFKALVVDDERLFAEGIARELKRTGVEVCLAGSCAEALRFSERERFGVILLDHRLPDGSGIDLIPQLLARQPKCALVMMTAYHTIPDAVAAIRRGAEDYIVKELSLEPLVARVQEIRQRQALLAGLTGWQEHKSAGLLGQSPAIQAVREQLERIRTSPETTVLFTGETGVGKEVAARTLHGLSGPANRPFLAVDCVALPSNLAESLLFGHEKGAFTGAEQARAGIFEEAQDGSVLLDEIGDVPELQGKLLRVLESRSFSRVGSVKAIPLRARVMAATNQDLGALVKEGRFRHDLYQRLSVFPIHLPPLGARGEDILLLANHFLRFYAQKLGKELSGLSSEVEAHLRAYTYPGNVRELKNIIERAVIMTTSGRLEPKHLPERVLAREARSQSPGSSIPVDFRPGVDTLESLEKRMIVNALSQAQGVKAEAARLLGISRFQLLRRMERHGLKERAGEGERDETGATE